MSARNLAAASGAALLLLGVQPALADSDVFRSFVKSYYDAEYAAHPVGATRAGIHDYDTKLDDVSEAGQKADMARLHEALKTLDAMDPKTLSAGDRDDREVMIGNIKGALLDGETIQYWRKDPGRYTRVATGGVFELVHRDFAPVPERLRDAIARERLIPAVLAAGKANIQHPPKAFVEIALRNLGGSIAFYKTAAPAAFADVGDADLKRDFAAANDAAVAALEDYKTFLGDQLKTADGEFALGPKIFEERMADNEMVDLPVPKLREVAYKRLHDDQAALQAAVAQIDPNQGTEHVVESLRANHPTAETLLSTADADLKGLREFVVGHHIATVPSDLLPKVEDTPGFQRATTAAAMDWPGPFEQHATQAFYYVSPPDAGLSPDKLEDYMRAYYEPGLELISTHEVWPGHFMQYLSRRAHPEWTLARQLAHAQSTTEGWAHYTEQMMVEEGLGNGDPKVKVAQLTEALLRDCRFVSALAMHTEGKSVEDAAQIFMKECGSPEAEARREAFRGTSDPGYLNYTVGKLEILKLREDYKKKLGDKFSLQEFHDRFLGSGLVPVKIIRRELMGEDGELM
jgi:uncharacterized protein (DUF885 family)